MAIGRRLSYRGRHSTRPRRRVEWARLSQPLINLASGNRISNNCLGPFETDLGASLIGATIFRTIISGFVINNTAGAGLDLTFGLIKEDILFQGNPIQQPNADWHWVEAVKWAPPLATEFTRKSFTIDTKVRRKLNSLDETVLAIFWNPGPSVYGLSYRIDTLVALP